MEIIDTTDILLDKVCKIIEECKTQLICKVLDESYLDEIVEFVNCNYFDKDGDYPIVYTKELMSFYLKDSIPIFFYSKNNPNKVVASIIGKFKNINAFNKQIYAFEDNFFCIIPPLRKLQLPKLLTAYLIRETIYKHKSDVKFAYSTTSDIINVKPICSKCYIHRYINFTELINLQQINQKKNTALYKKYYSKFVYPDNFTKYKVNTVIHENQIDEITDKLNIYQNKHFDIYENVSSNNIRDLNNSNAFYKFVITDNDNIIGFISFFKLDILNKKINKLVRTLYLYYYFCNGNFIDYLEYIGEYLHKHDICDMFLMNLFDDNVPSRYVKGNGLLYYNLHNVKHFDIKEQRVKLCMI